MSNSWHVNINGKNHFRVVFTGDETVLFSFHESVKQSLFKEIKAFVKKNREWFVTTTANFCTKKIAGEEIKFWKER